MANPSWIGGDGVPLSLLLVPDLASSREREQSGTSVLGASQIELR
ncbi:MAG: hypothetical protein Q4G68_14550 [Planctomycetia bacterium]|nr:hypothetical protein [Planctomycetia bacterium]